MKIRTLTALAIIALTLGACSKMYAADVAGTYTGQLTLSVEVAGQRMSEGPFDAKVIVEETGDNTVSLTLPSAGEGMMSLPEMTMPEVAVDKNGKDYTLARNGYSVNAGGYTFSGDLAGTLSGSTLSLSYSLGAAGVPHAITVSFNGR